MVIAPTSNLFVHGANVQTLTPEMDHPGPSQQPQINANSEEGQPMMNDHSNDKVGALGLTFTRLMEMAREMAMNLSMNQDVRVIQINIFEGVCQNIEPIEPFL